MRNARSFLCSGRGPGKTSPLWGEIGAERRVRGIALLDQPPLTPTLSPRRRGSFLSLAKAMLVVGFFLLLLGNPAFAATEADPTDPAVFRLAIFVLAIFVGYYVVWSVTPALHTPLMSVTNAISSVIVVGALLATAVPIVAEASWTAKIFGFLALVMASVNIFGGFLVTQRMLGMYKKKAK
jgi:NAD(P) transhydrogenase subunit alpha